MKIHIDSHGKPMFEKSKSAEPEGSSAVPSRTVRLKIQIDPPKSPLSNRNNEELSNTRKDGTESVNSFLAVDKDLLEVVDRKRKTLIDLNFVLKPMIILPFMG